MPDPAENIVIRGQAFLPSKICEFLEPYLSEERRDRVRTVVEGRTRSVVSVIEGITNYGNVSAVMRTAEGLGFFEVHVVTGDQPYRHSRRTSQGAEKWLDVRQWDGTADCLKSLRGRGYRIVATDAGPDSIPATEVDFSGKTALVLGNESDGVSAAARQEADVICRVDMHGFVESYNISVAAALLLYHAYSVRVAPLGCNGDLSDHERCVLEATYYLRAIARSEEILLEEARRAGLELQSDSRGPAVD